MSLTCARQGPTTQIRVAGEIDMSNAHLLVELVGRLPGRPPPRIALDLSEVTYFGAHGITALLRARHLALHRGGQFTLRDLSPAVRHILALAGVRQELGVADPPAARDGRRAREAGVVAGSALSYPG
ncbi:STAS domain-containing protein [Micromonospora sp. RHAY321]|uniref:STAS domain-containing protein n=1 Tax=Micromonospora sp. RHAY321 TaxID=2944807 RepID=UPI00207D111F|nr:STAS domain-containing protein [Micromonospora sp. RHAY321]MCO1595368.1 STAS domain-containing protein [Micromonospora sp. RHAY321]